MQCPKLRTLLPTVSVLASTAAACAGTQSAPVAKAPPPPASIEVMRPSPPTPSAEPDKAPEVPAAPEPPPPERPMITTRDFVSPIYDRPSFGSQQLGYLRAGTRVVRSSEPVDAKEGEGCAGGWYKIEPYGFVCNGRFGVTIQMNDPGVVAASRSRPRNAPLSFGYGNSQGAPGYDRVPTLADLGQREPDLANWQKRQAAERAKAAEAARHPEVALPLEPMPDFLANHAKIPILNSPTRMPYVGGNVRIAFVTAFESMGRPYYLTTEHLVVPADRFKAAKLTSFRGTELSVDGLKNPRLPLVWMRLPPSVVNAHVYMLEGSELSRTEVSLGYQTWAEVEPNDVVLKGVRYHVLLKTPEGLPEPGASGRKYLVKGPEAVRLDAQKDLPRTVEAGETWIDVSLSRQTLTVYEGTRPVFTTLVSTGAGGKNKDTPYGNFRVYQKHHTTKMSGRENPAEGEHFYRFDDVPYTQYLVRGVAIHASFWHDGFGVARSHGCINMSPWDAQRVFRMTSPELPVGWHGVYPGRGSVPMGTLVQIRG